MKKILSPGNNSNTVDIALLAARIGIAALMLVHGLPKLGMLFSGEPVQFPPVLGMSPEMSLAMAVFAEVVCSLFILVGFATRLATLPLIVTMLVAVVMIHAADPFSAKELGMQYLLAYLVLLFAGPGRYSVDQAIWGKGAAPAFSPAAANTSMPAYR